MTTQILSQIDDQYSETTTKVSFRTAEVKIDKWNVYAEFKDGVINQFWLPGVPKNYNEIALLYGYSDSRRYAVEHELAHHFIADNLGFKWSWAVHDGASFEDRLTPDKWPPHIAWEEGLVNAFQAHCHADIPDKWRVLNCVFPEKKLRDKKQEFLELCGKVLDKKTNIVYNHETGYIGYKHEPFLSR